MYRQSFSGENEESSGTIYPLQSALSHLWLSRSSRALIAIGSAAPASLPPILRPPTVNRWALHRPWKFLRRKRSPISGDLRDDIGVRAGVIGLLHTVVEQRVRASAWHAEQYSPRTAEP